MNNKNFSFFVFLILTAFAVVSSGGCGGGSSSSSSGGGTAGTVVIDDELADSDTPDILEFEYVASKSYTSDKNTVIQNASIPIPSRNRLSRLMPVKSADVFTANLTAGTEYTVEISKGEYYTEPIGYNLPDVEIITPAGNALGFADDTTGTEYDKIELSVYPEEEPYIICLTFTPSVTGDYKINLCQSVSQDAVADDVTLFIYKELRNDNTGEAGYYKRYKFQDKQGNLSDTISMHDIMALRKAYNDASESIIEGWVISGDEEIPDADLNKIIETDTDQAQAYLDCVRIIKQYYGIFDDYKELEKYKDINSYEIETLDADENETAEATAAANKNVNTGIKAPAELYGIPYDDSKTLGAGFFAITGKRSSSYAFRRNSINLTIPDKKKVKTLFKAGFVSSQEDAERFASTTTDTSVQLGGFGFDTLYSGSNSLKFGLTSSTFLIHYEETEPEYRMLDDDEDYQLTNYMRYLLNNQGGARGFREYGSRDFREEYGDYFVGGYQYGATFDAFITITTKTPEQLERVKERLPELLKSEKDVENASVVNDAKKVLNDNEATVNVAIRTAGVNAMSYTFTVNTNDVSAIAASLAEFRTRARQLKPAALQPVYVMLKRFRLLPDVFKRIKRDGDDGLIPISIEHAKRVMTFRKDMLTMHAYYNTVSDIAIMDYLVKVMSLQRYKNIRHNFSANENFFDEENASQLRSVHNDMLKFNSEMKDLADRHVFYQLLMAEQTKERNPSGSVLNRPYGPGGGAIGYQSFMSSKAVQSDINEGRGFGLEINTFSIYSTWEPKFDAGVDRIFCHIKVTANNINDRERKATPPNIGHRTADFFFQCGVARWRQWKVELRSMRLNSKLYPFTGLR